MSTLERLPDEDFSRILCVAAHPDDLEYGTSAAVAAWVARGVEVAYLLLTHGEAGMDRPPAEIGPLRDTEQRAACDAVGVSSLTILDFPDGVLSYGLDLRRAIAAEIRRFRPDVVVTGSWEEEVPWGLNQADHRAAGLATLDAIRDAANPWVFPVSPSVGAPDTWQARWLLVSGASRPTHAVDVTGDPLARGIASLASHVHYLAHVTGHASPEDTLRAATTEPGVALGVQSAVAFRAHRL
ncbi:PIG-L deacetylase family protein [Raineyella fluvialis]|uniref:PIG-L family deacetylase n=1 Tax=Raineyella fluvialis TaxID=2662261 RepID=A0A5Q2FE15_9ACTN|nr:PIG-L deacetylase family protein [Raineyella fluvialis]QGF24611.1 PIG-L family deacetylase [Raineyella fluvialis]